MEGTKYKVLLIEDDKLDRMAFLRMAEDKHLPYRCTVAGSWFELGNPFQKYLTDFTETTFTGLLPLTFQPSLHTTLATQG